MAALALAATILLGVLLARVLNHAGLRGWRRANGEHWSERARVLYPARTAAKTFVWFLPVVVVALRRWVWPGAIDLFPAELLAALVGVLLGTWYFDREIIPWLTWEIWWQEVVVGWGALALRCSAYAVGISLIGPALGWQAAIAAGAVIAFDLWLGFGGLLRVFRFCGVIPDAPERVQSIIADVCRRMNVPMPAVWACRSSSCNAFALFGMKTLLFTDVLIARLSDAEIRGVAAHELAHLDETRATRVTRFAVFLAFWPWLFVRPMIGNFGVPGVFMLLLWWWFVHYLMAALSRRMESRADRMAVGHDEADAVSYATALARIYEVNLMPAVMPKGSKTHPHLYDRLLAAGVTPDFPRPIPAEKQNFLGTLVSIAFGVLLVTQLRDVVRSTLDWFGRG